MSCPDLPDYTRLIAVSVDLPDIDIGSVNVGRYVVSPVDLADGDRTPLITDIKGRLIVRLRDIDALSGKLPVIPSPIGGKGDKGSVTSTSSYQTVAEYVVTDGKSFHISKIVVSTEKAAWFKLRWNGTDISCERLMDSKTIVLEHFPWNYYAMAGDGSKKFDIQVKYYSSAGIVNAEIVGEEVST